MPRAAAAPSTSGATLPRLLTRRRPQHQVQQPSPPESRSSSPTSPTLGCHTLTSRHLARAAARNDSGQPVSTSCYSTTTATGPSTNASTSGAAGIETEQDFGMSQDGGDSIRSSPVRTKHRPGPPPATPPISRRGYSDETPAGRIKHARHSPTFSSRHRGKARAGTVKQDDCADDADDEQQLSTLTTPRHRKRASKEEVASPSRKHRFKRLITKGSKLNLHEAGRSDSIISSPNQELCMPPPGAYKTTPITPPREISSPISSYAAHSSSFPRRASPMMSPPAAFDFIELWPQGQLGSRSQYGFDATQTASPGRAEKAARILGEEVKATGKAARVLGIEQKAFPETKSSASSLPPRVSSPSSSERSLQITLSTPPQPPTTPNPSRHDRQRSLSGPAAFASLEIPLTSTEEGSSSLATEASCSVDDIHICFHFRTPATDPIEESASKTATSSGIGLGLGLATPPPSPPSVPSRPPGAAIEEDAPSEDAQLSRGANRSKVASVASSTYAPSVYEGSDDGGVRNRHRLTLDSIRFSSAFEGVTGFSTSSGTGSQSQHSLPATRSTVSNPSARSSLQQQVVQRSLQQVGQRPSLASLSFSTPAVPKARGGSGVDERKPLGNGGSQSPARPSSPFRSESDPAGIPQLRTLQSTPRPQPERMSTFGSVASARTKNLQRSNALAALEGQPRLPTLGSAPRSGNERFSNGDGDTGGPPHPPPQGGLPPLPSLTTPAASPLQASHRPAEFLQKCRNSESFLDFGVSSGDEEDPGEQHRPSKLWSTTDTNRQGRPAPDVPDEVSALSARFSNLPLRQLELPRRQLAAFNGVGSGSGQPFLRGLEMPRNRSSPLLRLETSKEALQPKSPSPLSGLARKGSRTLGSILSLSSEGEDDEGSEEDLTSAFPHPPVIES